MRDFYGTFFMGAMLGAAAAVYYMHHESQVQNTGRRMKAKSKKAVNFLNNMGQDMENAVRRQENPCC